MLTRQGWALLVGAAITFLAARLFGLVELFIVGAALVILAVVAVLYVRVVTPRLRVRRTLTPARVHAGDAARVEVAATNIGNHRTPVLTLRDPVAGTRARGCTWCRSATPNGHAPPTDFRRIVAASWRSDP